ncbi:MAG: serine hydrolase [Bacteroidota bacterium]
MPPKLSALLLVLLVFSNCQKDSPNTPTTTPNNPAITNTFWQTDEPTNHGFSAATIEKVITEADQLNNFYALLIIRHKKLLVEAYFENRNTNTLFELRSVTKNITSALAGIAVEKKWINGVDEPIYTYFPNVNMTGQKRNITFEHLLNMSSGLSWDEDRDVLNLIQQRIPNSVNHLLSQPLVNPPGTVFDYNSLSPHVVGEVLRQQTNLSLSELAQRELFDPMDIAPFSWNTDPEGRNWGGFGLLLTARDLAKFGQLYLNEGAWEGQQIVPAEWVQQSSKRQIFTSSTGYSYQWWVSTQSETPLYYGQGFGGQGLILLPEKEVIIVALQEAWIPPSVASQQWNNFVTKVFNPILEELEK